MTKGLVKSSKKKQRLCENFLKDRNREKELNYKQYIHLFESLKNYYSELIDSYKYNIRKTWDIMKEIIGNKRATNATLPTLITVKTEKYLTKNKLRKHLIIILLISVPT